MSVALLLCGYLLGSIPTGVLVARTAGIDPRRAGSGNIGATNVTRTAGRRLGLITLLGDALKGAVAVWLTQLLSEQGWLAAAVGAAAVGGHLFSCFLRFRGGKGVATTFGVFLVLAPTVALTALAVFLLVGAAWRYVSLASIAAALALPIGAALFSAARAVEIVALVTSVAIVAKHWDNIRRLLTGTEPRLGQRFTA